MLRLIRFRKHVHQNKLFKSFLLYIQIYTYAYPRSRIFTLFSVNLTRPVTRFSLDCPRFVGPTTT